jgi:hypothetical protein
MKEHQRFQVDIQMNEKSCLKILQKPNLRSKIYEILETLIVKCKTIILLKANVEEKELIHETFYRTVIELP